MIVEWNFHIDNLLKVCETLPFSNESFKLIFLENILSSYAYSIENNFEV
jgi:hypothetical protein